MFTGLHIATSSNYLGFPLLCSAMFPPCLIFAWLKMRNVLVEFILSLKKEPEKKGIKSNKANSYRNADNLYCQGKAFPSVSGVYVNIMF